MEVELDFGAPTANCRHVANASVSMRRNQALIEPRHDHAPDTDDVWAWIIIGLLAGSVALTGWLPLMATFRV